MPRLTTVLAIVFVMLIAFVAKANPIAGALLDPVTTYSNGMPLASSTPLRSHNAYYQCDPYRTGCCGGRYNMPCLNSLCRPNDCCTGARPPAEGAFGPTVVSGSTAAVEPLRFEQIGVINVDTSLLAPQGANRPPVRPR